ncbi:MAG: hypothetical protein LUG95_09270 [Clostridiales bacterium]|nr:hypothetical protein [Clostridiales bacterium]
MKKFLAIILSVLMVGCVFAACSSSDDTSADSTDASGSDSSASEVTTDTAVIKESDAINFIKEEYTEEELGLDGLKDKYSFMVAESGTEIDGENYVKVAANVMTQSDVTTEDGNVTYNFQTVGEYYISFDGQTVLMKDLESGEYNELESRYSDYSAKIP